MKSVSARFVVVIPVAEIEVLPGVAFVVSHELDESSYSRSAKDDGAAATSVAEPNVNVASSDKNEPDVFWIAQMTFASFDESIPEFETNGCSAATAIATIFPADAELNVSDTGAGAAGVPTGNEYVFVPDVKLRRRIAEIHPAVE